MMGRSHGGYYLYLLYLALQCSQLCKVLGLVIHDNIEGYPRISCSAAPRYSEPQQQQLPPPTEELTLRRATLQDIPALQRCNRALLPENYPDKFYRYYLKLFPDLAVLAESTSLVDEDENADEDEDNEESDANGQLGIKRPKVVAYALGCIQERQYLENYPPPYFFSQEQRMQLEAYHRGHGMCPQVTLGHTISLAVASSHRRMGLASMMLQYLHYNMRNNYDAAACDLSVRVSNDAAIRLYEREGYHVAERMVDYYKQGGNEDGYTMQKYLIPSNDVRLESKPVLPRQMYVFREPKAPNRFGSNHKGTSPKRISSSRTYQETPLDFYSGKSNSLYVDYLDRYNM